MPRTTTLLAAALALLPGAAGAHAIAEHNAEFVATVAGPAVAPFVYLGAKHMVTGYDHVLFLVGVVFFLRHARDVVLYVSLFTLGHSLTLIGGVLGSLAVDPYLIDAVIGFSVAYKAFENIGGFDHVLPFHLDTRAAVFAFGLAHGLGLATRVGDLTATSDGLLTNLASFNLGVEIGQVLVLLAVVLILARLRAQPSFPARAHAANVALMAGGFVLAGYQLTGLIVT